ncbi:MAG: hypothetical protein IPO09_09450 [Anaeromyxobacter sp.]|nr:hypothetical protein [Anaeromyxobacter sp.]MBL0278662.1 hypothetical protein [Anaeromyxobacter sp.]
MTIRAAAAPLSAPAPGPAGALLPTAWPGLAGAARALGLTAVAGNVLGVAFLWDVPSPYRPGDVAAWLAGSQAQPLLTILSSWSFVVGLVALAAFLVLLALAAAPRARAPGWVVAGALLAAFGALLNAAGCFGPAVAVRFLPPGEAGQAVGLALLAVTLHLDAHFNLVLGLGLLAINLGAGEGLGWPRWLRALGVLAGLASLPVALQFWSDPFAKLLAISGPLWLAWFTAVALRGPWAPAGR